MQLTLSRYYHLQKTKIDAFDSQYLIHTFFIAKYFLKASISVLYNRQNDTLRMYKNTIVLINHSQNLRHTVLWLI